jgi:hypothetical protein
MTTNTFIERYMNAVGQYTALHAQLALEYRWIWDSLDYANSITDDDLTEFGITASELAAAVASIQEMHSLMQQGHNTNLNKLRR